MKFRFCGDGDCPEWVLAEIHSTLSMLTSVKLRILTQLVVQSILGDEIPEDKLKETFAANKSDLKPIKSAFACIRFLIVNATCHNADDATFDAELQQLGLPKEHSAAMCKIRSEHLDAIRTHLTNNSLKVNELSSISYTIPRETTVDCAQLTIEIANELVDGTPTKTNHKINVSKADICILLDELRTIDKIMQDMNYEKRNKSVVNSNGK